MLINLHNRFESFLVQAKFEAGERLPVVSVWAVGTDKRGQIEPFPGILELSSEEMTASGVVNAPVVLRINLDTREIVVERNIVCLVAILAIA